MKQFVIQFQSTEELHIKITTELLVYTFIKEFISRIDHLAENRNWDAILQNVTPEMTTGAFLRIVSNHTSNVNTAEMLHHHIERTKSTSANCPLINQITGDHLAENRNWDAILQNVTPEMTKKNSSLLRWILLALSEKGQQQPAKQIIHSFPVFGITVYHTCHIRKKRMRTYKKRRRILSTVNLIFHTG